MTKAQIDRLGERRRVEAVTEPDLRLLDEYGRSFGASYQEVLWVLRERGRGHLEPTGRFPKTPGSIVGKLKREPSIRLTQVQDIAGCRIVVPGLEEQNVRTVMIEALFSDTPTRIFDRRVRPSHGYRAIHIVVIVREHAVEIQLRTGLQHLWAELSEKLSDRFGIDVKYGGGPRQLRILLSTSSQRVAEIELFEQELFEIEADIDMKPPATQASLRAEISDFRQKVEHGREELSANLRDTIALVQRDTLNWDVQ